MNISIIIPTLNEAATIAGLVRSLRREDTAAEILVVDGGSSDATRTLAAAAGATVVTAATGRGQQLAVGAAAATGEAFLFLHADTVLGPGGLARLREVLADPAVSGGNFRVVFDGANRFSHWLTGFYAWFRRRGVYYGDSAIFVRRDVYAALGGIRPVALMEDFEFSRRLERWGGTVCITTPPVLTSARRFRGRSAAAIVTGWLIIHALYYLNVSPQRLARLYDSGRHRSRAA